MSDVHGRADLLAPLLAHFHTLPKEADSLFVNIGDAINRGRHNREAVALLMDQDNHFDQSEILAGNHEIFLIDAFWSLGVDPSGLIAPRQNIENTWLWLDVGGEAVYREFSPERDMLFSDLPPHIEQHFGAYIRRLAGRSAPHHVEGDLLFVHAGVVPGQIESSLRMGLQDQVVNGGHWAWIREPFLQWKGGWDKPERLIIHGHSICAKAPFMSMEEARDAMVKVRKKGRICLDIGAHCYGQLAGFEAVGNRYRIHISRGN
ncbi:metallophosphoesterase [Paracoccus litorisediminis]|uniref:metallophosphoesterase n=1 Tax=Paracoccus litorisediminis TaxID=2006130 RepID=UPI003732B4A5